MHAPRYSRHSNTRENQNSGHFPHYSSMQPYIRNAREKRWNVEYVGHVSDEFIITRPTENQNDASLIFALFFKLSHYLILHLDNGSIAKFQREPGAMGYK